MKTIFILAIVLFVASVSCHKKKKHSQSNTALQLSTGEQEDLRAYFEWIATAEETPVLSNYVFKRVSNQNQMNCIDGQFGCSTSVDPEDFYASELNRLIQLACIATSTTGACSADICSGITTTYTSKVKGKKTIGIFKVSNAPSALGKLDMKKLTKLLGKDNEVIGIIKNHSSQLYAGYRCTQRCAAKWKKNH